MTRPASLALRSSRPLVLVLTVVAALTQPRAGRAQVPEEWIYTGVLFDGDEPASGPLDVSVAVYDVPDGGDALWTEAHTDVDVEAGVFTLQLGTVDADPLAAELWANGTTLWLEVTVEGDLLEPRVPVASVPYAQRAQVASELENEAGLVVNDNTLIDADGTWTGSSIDGSDVALDSGATLDELEAALGQAQADIADLEAALDEDLANVIARLDGHDSDIGALEAADTNANTRLDDHDTAIAALESANADTQTRLDGHDDRLAHSHRQRCLLHGRQRPHPQRRCQRHDVPLIESPRAGDSQRAGQPHYWLQRRCGRDWPQLGRLAQPDRGAGTFLSQFRRPGRRGAQSNGGQSGSRSRR